MDDNLPDYLQEVEDAVGRLRAEIRAQDIFIELLLKAASASIDANRDAILTALWVAQVERTENNGVDDETARILGRFSARLHSALARTPREEVTDA